MRRAIESWEGPQGPRRSCSPPRPPRAYVPGCAGHPRLPTAGPARSSQYPSKDGEWRVASLQGIPSPIQVGVTTRTSPGRVNTAHAEQPAWVRIRRASGPAPGRRRKRAAGGIHGRSARSSEPTNESTPAEQEDVVEVRDRLVGQTYLGPQDDLGGKPSSSRGDRRADHGVKETPHWIPGENEDGSPFARHICEPDLASTSSGVTAVRHTAPRNRCRRRRGQGRGVGWRARARPQ
jgi:hypothetical protein